jgi:hypothetical protein
MAMNVSGRAGQAPELCGACSRAAAYPDPKGATIVASCWYAAASPLITVADREKGGLCAVRMCSAMDTRHSGGLQPQSSLVPWQ